MSLNGYERVKLVLDEDYAQIGGSKEQKDSKIASALDEMSSRFKNISNSDGPTYYDPVVRFAYVFRYVTSQANLVYLSPGLPDNEGLYKKVIRYGIE
jgi:hypothetical protein